MMTREQAITFLKNNPAEYGRRLGFTRLTALHNTWIQEMAFGQDDHTLQASRGTYKTTCVSIALALIIMLLPKKKTAFMRKTDADVKEVVRQVQKILEHKITQAFAQVIYGKPFYLTTRSATEINTNLIVGTKGTSQLIGIGTGGSLTGKHFDRIFTDDIVNMNDRTSKAERDRTKLIYQELQNIKNRDGRIFNSGTPWHPEDCFSIMPTPERFDCYDPAFAGIFTEDILAELKQGMTNSLFAANYELRHVAEDDVIFTDPQTGAEQSKVMYGTSHTDAAFYGEDYTAFTVCAVHNERFYVFGKCWRKHIDDVMDEIVGWHEHFLCGKMYCELNADKGYVAKQFRQKGLKVSTYNETQNKYVKITSHLKFEWQNVIFVEGTDPEYIAQICDYNENAEHDDCPDSLASLVRVMARKRVEVPYKSIFEGDVKAW